MMMGEGKAGGGGPWQDFLVAPERIEWPEGGPLSCVLGQGSYGMVCRVGVAPEAAGAAAVHVALKIPTILRDPAREPRVANPFWRDTSPAERQRQQEMWHSEVELLARAQGSPYVTRLVGVVLDERGDPEFILTELAAGSLYAMLHDNAADGGDGPRGGRPVSLEEATWMMLNIARGLRHLHEVCDPPITHRDLSAKNVLRVSGCLLALTDLGQAKTLRGRGTDTLNPGAEVYAAPESLVEGGREPGFLGKTFTLADQTVKMDIFSFGVLSLEICTGCFPRPGREYDVVGGGMARLRTQLERRAEHLGLMEGAHPLKPLVVRCLAEDPGERPSAAEVVQELEALGAMEHIQEAAQAAHVTEARLEAQLAQSQRATAAAERRAAAATASATEAQQEARRAIEAAEVRAGRAAAEEQREARRAIGAAEARIATAEARVVDMEEVNRQLTERIEQIEGRGGRGGGGGGGEGKEDPAARRGESSRMLLLAFPPAVNDE